MARHDRLVRRQLRSRYLVTTIDGETFAGVLLDVDDMHLVLVDAEQIAPNGDRLPIDGQLWQPRLAVRYMQLVNP